MWKAGCGMRAACVEFNQEMRDKFGIDGRDAG